MKKWMICIVSIILVISLASVAVFAENVRTKEKTAERKTKAETVDATKEATAEKRAEREQVKKEAAAEKRAEREQVKEEAAAEKRVEREQARLASVID